MSRSFNEFLSLPSPMFVHPQPHHLPFYSHDFLHHLVSGMPPLLIPSLPFAPRGSPQKVFSHIPTVAEQGDASLQPRKRKQQLQEDEEGDFSGQSDSKRYRTTYSPYQTRVLEEIFLREHYISRPQRAQLAGQLQLPENTIKIWFQNRRMKEKRQSLMLPSIAGNDPQLRDALMQIAELYSNFQLHGGQEVVGSRGELTKMRSEYMHPPFNSESGRETFQSDSTNSTLSLSPNIQFPPPPPPLLVSSSSSSSSYPHPPQPSQSRGFSMEDILFPQSKPPTSSPIDTSRLHRLHEPTCIIEEPVTPTMRVKPLNCDNINKLFRPFKDYM